MTVEPMTDEEFWFDSSLLDAENQALFEVAPIAKFRRWADHMRETGTALHTKAGITIDAALLDAVLATISTLTAERDQHANAYIDLHGQHVAKMLELADARTALKRVEAERDAAVARAMPGWRYLATWDAVNTVEARHNDEPAPGLYAIWKPGWPYPSAASVQFGVFATDEESPAPDDYLLGAWISGPLPLPDLPTPTAGETP